MSASTYRTQSNWPRSFAFVLVPDFSMMPFTAALEPLRVANRMRESELYRWSTLSSDGGPVRASNGTLVEVDGALAQAGEFDAVVVCAGIDAYDRINPALAAQLRRLSRRDCLIGSVCSGSIILADAGLLEGRRCTGHWEDLETLAENYPALEVTKSIFEIDGSRFTCSGGTAPLDLMIHFISMDFGRDLAAQVADQMLHHSARQAAGPQRLDLSQRTGVRNPRLLDVISAMEANLENPLSLSELAEVAGLSLRQLERLFAAEQGSRPGRYYRQLRLQRARQLIQKTGLSMLEVAVATGFSSGTHFARSYRAAFGRSPSSER
ncbi:MULTISPECIES: GlxA family transcriptional regulator [unclassified Novosphingobium]|uniref:GlxA family transcriptional regulator n=1 Tax=unclassified Novosphingobium TaxID=2644732 RepID=UPI0025FD137F|nr:MULTISPECIES: GlxA family transcriptional regulator [unclassified Novosphingobium]HQV02008.1 GlxA family transcriptional regulator [Novosphingobium sp.]